MDAVLDKLSLSVTSARSLEALTRPLLELLRSVTGMESAYLTSIDLDQGVQQVLFADNAGALQIPEGLSVPWEDTLCKRSIESDIAFTDDVPGRWGDSLPARELGLQTYLSLPVRLPDGRIYGTLCAASLTQKQLPPDAKRLLLLFTHLIAQQVEREQLIQQLLLANEKLTAAAATDPLTGLGNRRTLEQELARMLAQGARHGCVVLVAFLDLDDFKQINDSHGHDVGDRFLQLFAQRLHRALRAGDLAARWGGDEFVVAGPGPSDADGLPLAAAALQRRIEQATTGVYRLDDLAIDYSGASIGVLPVAPGTLDASEALRQADAAMYRAKVSRSQRGRKASPGLLD